MVPTDVVDRVVAVLAELRSDVPVEVELGTSVQLSKALRRGDLELTIAHLPLGEPGFEVVPLAQPRPAAVAF